MGSVSALAISLSVLLGSFLLLVLAELYYLLCWKRATSNPRVISVTQDGMLVQGESSDLIGDAEVVALSGQFSLASAFHAELIAKLFPVSNDGESDGLGVDNLLVPPRMLFTIKEETKEDLEADDATSKNRSQRGSQGSSEFLPRISSGISTPPETPYVTPPTSPPASFLQEPPLASPMSLPFVRTPLLPHIPAPTSPPSPPLTPMNTFMSSPLITLTVPMATLPLTPPSSSPARPFD
ncbi:hypothetical protein O6H91_19G050400 [Diphasiastrum complanatum]|uniref:Uncharacterized protein n=1 Tax=Diphasiastrum complanatum TaxID=34168 RepID=A0ACC2AUZ9_DIPCM|nr:hypothetical protein O6H91_19G050400 [Diphasiastrum complanatum]